MSANANPELEEKRQQINRLIDEIARLSESQLGVNEFFAEYLQRLMLALAAPAGVIWSRTPQGNLQLVYQINFNEVGLDAIEGARPCHDELLRYMVQQGRSMLVPPNSGPQAGKAGVAPANLTNYTLLLVPIAIDRQTAGVIEIWVDPGRNPQAVRGFMQFLEDMSSYAGSYLRNHQLRQMVGQQAVWTQLETFAKNIHGSLKPKEAGYLIVNEARRLLGVDRVSIAGRLGGYTQIEAVSGADVVEKRSALVQNMRALMDAVLVWNEKLVYSGTRDESLPPKVNAALDNFLAESNSKLLIVAPLRDDREDKDRPCRTAMMIESFEPTFSPEQLLSKAEIVGKHAAPAFYNALEHHRVPLRMVLMPLANLRDSLRGQRLAWAMAILAGVVALTLALILIPYPLRMYAKGKLVPRERETVYATTQGRITKVHVEHGSKVDKRQVLLDLQDFEMKAKIDKALREKKFAEETRERVLSTLNSDNPNLTAADKQSLRSELAKAEFDAKKAEDEYKLLLDMVGGDPDKTKISSPLTGTVVTFDLSELPNREVKQGDKLLQVARLDGPWLIEARIPEENVGHVREALAQFAPKPLEVDIQLSSQPGKRYRGYLYRDGLGGEVTVHNNEPVLTARIQLGDELAGELKKLGGGAMPNEAEVSVKIRCGNRAVGYVFFYQLWEFFFEHVIF